jgi:hypothetical protein
VNDLDFYGGVERCVCETILVLIMPMIGMLCVGCDYTKSQDSVPDMTSNEKRDITSAQVRNDSDFRNLEHAARSVSPNITGVFMADWYDSDGKNEGDLRLVIAESCPDDCEQFVYVQWLKMHNKEGPVLHQSGIRIPLDARVKSARGGGASGLLEIEVEYILDEMTWCIDATNRRNVVVLKRACSQ